MSTAVPPPRARNVRRWIFAGVTAVLLAALLWVGWYGYNRGFTRKWRDQLTAELRRRGFDMTYSKLTLNPFEGLVIEEAHLYLLDPRAPAGHGTHLLYISRAAVDLSLANLIQKKPFLNSLDLRGARLTIPVDMGDPGGPKVRLHHFEAKLAILPGEVRLTQAEGDFYGVQVSLSGTLLHPESFQPGAPATAEVQARRRQLARTIIEQIRQLHFDRAPPRLSIRFQGDVARPAELRADAEFQAESLHRGNCSLDRVLVRADYAAGAFHLQQVELADAHGTLAGQGDYNPGTGETRFQLQSTLDLVTLAREFADLSALRDFTFHDAPRLRLEGHTLTAQQAAAAARPDVAAPHPRPASNDLTALSPAGALEVTGHLALGHFGYDKWSFDQGESDFSWSGDRWYLRALRLVRANTGASTQAISADVLSEPERTRVRLTSTFDPTPFLSLLPPPVQEALARLEFRDAPRVELTATGRSLHDPNGLRAEGQLSLGRTRYRGVGINRLRANVAYANGLATLRRVNLERDEGSATGDEVSYDFNRHEVRLNNVSSTLDLGQVGVWLDPDVYHAIQPFHFRRPPTAVLNGNVQFAGGRNSHLVTDLSAPMGMDYVFLKKLLPFQSVAGQVVFDEERLQLNDLHAAIFDGEVRGALNLGLGKNGHAYHANVEVRDIDFARFTKLYFDYDNSKGRLSGEYHFTGRGEDAATLHGVGSLDVEHGNVFAIPFLGPLSNILGALLPGLGFDEAHQASVNFLTDHGKILTGNLDVKGLNFSLSGGGWLGYLNDTMNFRVRLNSRGLPGAVLYPVSKLFEYTSQGPLSKPVWHPSVLATPLPIEQAAPPPPAMIPKPR